MMKNKQNGRQNVTFTRPGKANQNTLCGIISAPVFSYFLFKIIAPATK